jgi:hypothetical protein
MHIHVNSPSGKAKVWLEPKVELASQTGLNPRELRHILESVTELQEVFCAQWLARRNG